MNCAGTVVTERELKGLDIVRRDWSELASSAGRQVVDFILSDSQHDDRLNNIHSMLELTADTLRQGKVSHQQGQSRAWSGINRVKAGQGQA